MCDEIKYKLLLATTTILLMYGPVLAQETPDSCVTVTKLEPVASTEKLPEGVCPIRKNFGSSSLCFDKLYRLEVHHTCHVAVRVHVDAGSGARASTGDYTLGVGNNSRTFTCLEENGHCTGVTLTVLGFRR
jgi:hypothetical protein